MADIKRLHYFDHQFLVEADFTDEQQYHLDMRRRHNKVLHTFGVADGLQVAKTGDKEITVRAGTAVDRDGREMVLDVNHPPLNLSEYLPNSEIYVTIAYNEQETDPTTATGVNGNTRMTEKPVVNASTTTPPGDGSIIRLARFALDGSGNVPGNIGDTFDNVVRQIAGPVIPSGSVGPGELASNAVTSVKIAEADGTTGQNTNTGAGIKMDHIQNGAVTESKLGNNSVNAAKIIDGSVGPGELASNAVTSVKIAEADGTTQQDTNNGSGVKTDHIQDGAVTGEKIANGAVTAVKIASDVASTSYVDEQIDIALGTGTLIQGVGWVALPPHGLLWPLWSPALSPPDPVTGVETPVVYALDSTSILPIQPCLIWDPVYYPRGPIWLLYNVPPLFGGGLTFFEDIYGFMPFPPHYLLDPVTLLPITISLPPGYETLSLTIPKQFALTVNIANLIYSFTYGLTPEEHNNLLRPADLIGSEPL